MRVQHSNRLPVPPTQSALYEPEYSPRRVSRELQPSHLSPDADVYSSREIGVPAYGGNSQMPTFIQDNETGQLYELDPSYGEAAGPPRAGILPSTVAKGYLIALFFAVVGVALYFAISSYVIGQDKQQKKAIIQATISGGQK